MCKCACECVCIFVRVSCVWLYMSCMCSNTYVFEQPSVFECMFVYEQASLVAQTVKSLPAKWETWIQSVGGEDPLEEEMAIHSSILAWRILWAEEPGGMLSIAPWGVGHDWTTNTFMCEGVYVDMCVCIPVCRCISVCVLCECVRRMWVFMNVYGCVREWACVVSAPLTSSSSSKRHAVFLWGATLKPHVVPSELPVGVAWPHMGRERREGAPGLGELSSTFILSHNDGSGEQEAWTRFLGVS